MFGRAGGGTNFGIPQRRSISGTTGKRAEHVPRHLHDLWASSETEIRQWLEGVDATKDAQPVTISQSLGTMTMDYGSALAWDNETGEEHADWLTGALPVVESSSGLVMNIDVPKNFDNLNVNHDLHASLAYSGSGPLASSSALPAGLDHAVFSFAAGTAYALNPDVAPPLTLPPLPAVGNQCAADCARFHCPTCERCEWDPVRGKVKWQRRNGKISGKKVCSRCGQAEGRQSKKIFGW